FFFQAEDGIRDFHVTGVQTCALPILTLARRWLGFQVRAPRQEGSWRGAPKDGFTACPAPENPSAALSTRCLNSNAPQLQAIRSLDRKSTRLNSSHVKISYAVFCLKKK